MFARVAFVVVILTPLFAPVSSATALSTEIVAAYPNPVAHEDAGEFVVVSFPDRTNLSNWTLSDGERAVELPDETVSGRVAFSTAPNLTRNLTSHRTLPVRGLSLANSGETVSLRRNGSDGRHPKTVDSITYVDAPSGELWRPDSRTWQPLGATDHPIVDSSAASARVFVLPDNPNVPIETLQSASDRILLAGYSFSSQRVARTLVAAQNRVVTVRVLVDDAPVGGLSRRKTCVCYLLTQTTSGATSVRSVTPKQHDR
ncbi:hypothetical protein [Haladaptatus sp. NG-WS-4]